MGKSDSKFGLKVIIRNYGWRSFWQDSILPLIFSSSLSIVAYNKDADILALLIRTVSVGISIVPAMVALILTAYTIILTFFTSDKLASVKNTEAKKKLIQDLNASFAACLIVSTVSIITMIAVSSIANMEISIEMPNRVNYPIYFIVCYLLIYTISILLGIAIDIFNSGQTILQDIGEG